MPQEQAHHPAGSLGLAVALAVVAGFVDAHVYVHVTPVFVANMSGNLVHLGIFAGVGDGRDAIASAAAIVAFLGGVAAATVHHDRQVRRERDVGPGFLLLVEGALVLAMAALLLALDVHFSEHPIARDYPVIVAGALAMGVQASALRRVGQVAVATTYGTGAIVRIGEKSVLAARRADRATNHRRRVTIAVLVSVLVGYVGGAVVAARSGSSHALLLAVAAALLALAVTERRRRFPPPPPEIDLEPRPA